jgi:hypothetical protein
MVENYTGGDYSPGGDEIVPASLLLVFVAARLAA